jgi:hypothetical protein
VLGTRINISALESAASLDQEEIENEAQVRLRRQLEPQASRRMVVASAKPALGGISVLRVAIESLRKV